MCRRGFVIFADCRHEQRPQDGPEERAVLAYQAKKKEEEEEEEEEEEAYRALAPAGPEIRVARYAGNIHPRRAILTSLER